MEFKYSEQIRSAQQGETINFDSSDDISKYIDWRRHQNKLMLNPEFICPNQEGDFAHFSGQDSADALLP